MREVGSSYLNTVEVGALNGVSELWYLRLHD